MVVKEERAEAIYLGVCSLNGSSPHSDGWVEIVVLLRLFCPRFHEWQFGAELGNWRLAAPLPK